MNLPFLFITKLCLSIYIYLSSLTNYRIIRLRPMDILRYGRVCRCNPKQVISRQWESVILTCFVQCFSPPNLASNVQLYKMQIYRPSAFTELSHLVAWTFACPPSLRTPRNSSLDFQAWSKNCASLSISWCPSLSVFGIFSPVRHKESPSQPFCL